MSTQPSGDASAPGRSHVDRTSQINPPDTVGQGEMTQAESHPPHTRRQLTMTTNETTDNPSIHAESQTGPHPNESLPSIGTMAVFVLLPVLTVTALSFPVVTVVVLAALCGGAAGIVLHRRHPNAVEKTVRLPDSIGFQDT